MSDELNTPLDRRRFVLAAAATAAAVAYVPFGVLAAPAVGEAAPRARLDDWHIDDQWGVVPRWDAIPARGHAHDERDERLAAPADLPFLA